MKLRLQKELRKKQRKRPVGIQEKRDKGQTVKYMAETIKYSAERVCNVGSATGLKGFEARRGLSSGQQTCPVDGISVSSEVGLSGSLEDNLARFIATRHALSSIKRWCQDPCPLCGVEADLVGGLKITGWEPSS